MGYLILNNLNRFLVLLLLFGNSYSRAMTEPDDITPGRSCEHCNDKIIMPDEYNAELDSGISNIGLQICLNKNNDLIFESLWWHFKLGFRNFEIACGLENEVLHDKISLFLHQTQNRPTIHIRNLGGAGNPCFNELIRWGFSVNSRQFLCSALSLSSFTQTYKEYGRIYAPSCKYLGLDTLSENQFSAVSKLIYRTNISLEGSFVILNYDGLNTSIETDTLYVSEYDEIEKATMDTDNLLRCPLELEIEKTVVEEIKENFNFFLNRKTILSDARMMAIHNFVTRHPMPYHFRFGHNYAYAMVPKNATSTISLILNSYEIQRLWKEVEPKNTLYYSFCHPFSFHHDRYQKLSDSSVFKFTIVRNPYVRILSAYLDRLCTEKRAKFNVMFGFSEEEIIPFETFLLIISTIPIDKLDVHFAPMWILTMFPVINYDSIIKMERLEKDFREVLKRLYLPETLGLYSYRKHATGSKRKLGEYYNENCINLVQSIYRDDFYHFCYDIDSFE